jgi:hypothetical protein
VIMEALVVAMDWVVKRDLLVVAVSLSLIALLPRLRQRNHEGVVECSK